MLSQLEWTCVPMSTRSRYEAVEEKGGEGGSSLRLERHSAGWCVQCNREHERDNARIFVLDGCAYFRCFRAAKGVPSVVLGRVQGVDDEHARLAQMEARRQRDLALVMPGSLLMAERDARQYVALPMVSSWRSLVVSSPMGTGKTHAVIRDVLLAEPRPRRVVLITSRKVDAMARQHRLRASGIDAQLYLDCEGLIGGKDGVWIVQAESMPRIVTGGNLRGWTVIIDESESVLMQMQSETMERVQTQAWATLIELVRHSERVVLLDAFASSRSVEFLSLVVGRPPRIVENTWRPERRVGVELKSFARFMDKACELLMSGKRLFVWVASAAKAKRLHERVTSLEQRKAVTFIRGGMGDDELRALAADVNSS